MNGPQRTACYTVGRDFATPPRTLYRGSHYSYNQEGRPVGTASTFDFRQLGDGMCAILLFLYPMHCYRVSICGRHRPSSGVRNRGEPKPLTRRESNPRPKDYVSHAHPPPAVGIGLACARHDVKVVRVSSLTSLKHQSDRHATMLCQNICAPASLNSLLCVVI